MMRLTEAVFINSCQTFIFFSPSWAAGIDPGSAVSASVLGRGMEAVQGRVGFLWHTTHPPPPQLLHEGSPIFKMKNQHKAKQNKESPASLDAAAWCMIRTDFSIVAGRYKGFPLFPLRNNFLSIDKHCEQRRGKRRDEMSRATRSFCQHLGRLTLGAHPAAGLLPLESVQGGSTIGMPRNAAKLWKCPYWSQSKGNGCDTLSGATVSGLITGEKNSPYLKMKERETLFWRIC